MVDSWDWNNLEAANTELRELVEALTRHLAYLGTTDGVPTLNTGGLSVLEEAFAVLGWDDPHPIEEDTP